MQDGEQDFLGRPWNEDQSSIGVGNGHAVCARALVRLVPDQGWNPNRLAKLSITPNTEKPGAHDGLESLPDPHGKFDARTGPACDHELDEGGMAVSSSLAMTSTSRREYCFVVSPHIDRLIKKL